MESYLSLKRQKDDQIPTVRIAQDAEQKSKEKAPLSDADVIGHLPATLRPKAATLLRRSKARPDVISWDESGQVKVDGKEIPDSNISDLVSDAMRARKNFNPKGAQEFFRGLSKINVPKDIARNTERWDQVQRGSPVRLARKRLFLRVPRNISVVYSEDRRRNQNNGFLIKKCCNCLHVIIKMF
jgi:hypothetical protein